MKLWLPIVLIVAVGSLPPLLSRASLANPPDAGHVEIERDGKPLPSEAVQALDPLLVRLLESCSVDSTTFVDQPAAWQAIPRDGAYLRVRWAEPRSIQAGGGLTARVDEMLFALGAGRTPDHLYFKSGERLRSFTKYRPEVLLAIAQEPVVGLAGEPPFAQWQGMQWMADEARALREAVPGH